MLEVNQTVLLGHPTITTSQHREVKLWGKKPKKVSTYALCLSL